MGVGSRENATSLAATTPQGQCGNVLHQRRNSVRHIDKCRSARPTSSDEASRPRLSVPPFPLSPSLSPLPWPLPLKHLRLLRAQI